MKKILVLALLAIFIGHALAQKPPLHTKIYFEVVDNNLLVISKEPYSSNILETGYKTWGLLNQFEIEPSNWITNGYFIKSNGGTAFQSPDTAGSAVFLAKHIPYGNVNINGSQVWVFEKLSEFGKDVWAVRNLMSTMYLAEKSSYGPGDVIGRLYRPGHVIIKYVDPRKDKSARWRITKPAKRVI